MSSAYIFCKTAEFGYEQVMSIIDAAINYPYLVLQELNYGLKQVEVLVFNGLMYSYNRLEKLVEDCAKIPSDVKDVGKSLCDAVMKCEFLYKSLLPKPTGGVYLDIISGEKVSGYEWVKRNVCSYGTGPYIQMLRDLYTSGVNSLVKKLSDETGLTWLKKQIREMTELYTEFLKSPIKTYWSGFPALFNTAFGWANSSGVINPETASIYDLIGFLNTFASCLFASCNLVDTVTNKISDLENRLSIDLQTKTYIPTKVHFNMYKKLQDANKFLTTAKKSPCYTVP